MDVPCVPGTLDLVWERGVARRALVEVGVENRWMASCSVRHKVCCVSGLLELVWVHFISWVWCVLMLLLRCVLDLGVVVKDGASWPGLEAICLRVRPSFRILLAMCVPGACVLRKRVRSLIKLS